MPGLGRKNATSPSIGNGEWHGLSAGVCGARCHPARCGRPASTATHIFKNSE
jgi:hypothetical protein